MRRMLIIGIMALASIGILASPASAVTESLAASSGTNTGSTTTVYAVVLVGSDVIIGGNFTSVVSTNGVSHSAGGLAALNASTGAWVWSATPGGTTYALGTDGTNIFAGGTYGVRRYSQAGVKSSFTQPYGVGTVHGIAASSSDVYYGGGNGVAAATTAGGGVWHISATNVRSVALNGSQLLVGGGFCTIGGRDPPDHRLAQHVEREPEHRLQRRPVHLLRRAGPAGPVHRGQRRAPPTSAAAAR